jgi:hypothetical protein
VQTVSKRKPYDKMRSGNDSKFCSDSKDVEL